MAIVTDSILTDFLLALIPLVYFVYWYMTNNDDYWNKRGVPNDKQGFILGLLLGKESQSDSIKRVYNQFSGQRFFGVFQIKKPLLIVRDPQLINMILVKDFTHFQHRGVPQPKHDPIKNSLFGLTGHTWRSLRYKLTPTFTTGKLRGMFDQVSKCGDNLIRNIEENPTGEDMNTKSLLFEFTLDVISSCAFGVQFQLNSEDFERFKLYVEKIFSFSPLIILKFFVVMLLPKLAVLLKISTTPSEVKEYFLNLTKTTIKYRKDNNIQRNDYFQLLLTLKEQEDSGRDVGLSSSDATEDDTVINQMQYTEDSKLSSNDPPEKLFTEETISANTFIFLTAGSETVARTIGFVLFELTQHPDIQQKLQQEVDTVLAKHGCWSYNAVREMTFLEQIVQETLRIFPAIPVLNRECVLPYKVPNSDLVIEKGVQVIIPVAGLHQDSQYYPEPDQFRPERFEGNNFKPNSTFLPFGDGPRICIAMRFAVMEVKSCVAKIMTQYSVKLSSKTQMPLKLKVRSFIPIVEGELWFSFEKRKKLNNGIL